MLKLDNEITVSDQFGSQIPKSRKRLMERLDHMVASGQVTLEEAARLRATEGSADFDAAVVAIRTRHAQGRLDLAIESGQMTQTEADQNLERLKRGEHPRALRAHLRQITSRRH